MNQVQVWIFYATNYSKNLEICTRGIHIYVWTVVEWAVMSRGGEREMGKT